jgi:UDP-N-acetylglucosamine 2-epimerase (non-hydrolysing)
LNLTGKKVLLVFGTRPEAIKLCPVIAALPVRPVVCVTGQHREMLRQVLEVFGVKPDYDLDLMQRDQTQTGFTSRLLGALEPVLLQEKPSLVVVQGDTTTAFCAALASFQARIPVAHVEAGLRTWDMQAPFPEEFNRTAIGRIATLHYPPTQWAADNLGREGVPPEQIEITGNTGIDAVLAVSQKLQDGSVPVRDWNIPEDKKLIVVTSHRRENFGDGFVQLCEAISDLAQRKDVHVVWPVHPNPNVRIHVDSLQGQANIELLEPLDYLAFVDLLRRSYLLITDSGGVQEEGPSLGKPILVVRERTERPEAVLAGVVKLVGNRKERIISEATRLLEDPDEYRRMARIENPYGDGRAAERIAQSINTFLSFHV